MLILALIFNHDILNASRPEGAEATGTVPSSKRRASTQEVVGGAPR